MSSSKVKLLNEKVRSDDQSNMANYYHESGSQRDCSSSNSSQDEGNWHNAVEEPIDTNNESSLNHKTNALQDKSDQKISDLTLHEAVFNNDASKIYEILKDTERAKNLVNSKDKHGNTPLHLACMLGRSKEIVAALLQCGAAVDTKNLNRWNPFHEACSYGNREIIALLTKQLKDEFMSSDIIDFELKSSGIQLTRSTRGWIWKADKVEKVGRYEADLYNFNNVILITRKRREHLTEEDLRRNKLAYKSAVHALKFGKRSNHRNLEQAASQDENDYDSEGQNDSQGSSDGAESVYRESLPPPPPTTVTWKQYCQAEPGHYPCLGREQQCKIVKTAFKASVAMSKTFPISRDEFLDLLSIIPLKLFKKLKEFIEMRLPDGFPVRLDIPVFPFLTARITFEDFTFLEGPIDESLFSIPSDYEEDPHLMHILSGKLKGNKDK